MMMTSSSLQALRSKAEAKGRSDMYKLEVFDADGLFLQEIPLNHSCHGIRVYGSRLLVLDCSESKVYQYKIEEKDIN